MHDVATPTLPASAEHRSPSQRIPDSFSLTNFSGIRSSAASSSVVNRGQFDEYEQHAPHAWQGLVSPVTISIVSIASALAQCAWRRYHNVGKPSGQRRTTIVGVAPGAPPVTKIRWLSASPIPLRVP